MSNVFTLDALRDETIKRYEPVEILLSDDSSIELTSVLRLAKKDREAVLATIEDVLEEIVGEIEDEFDEDDDEQVDRYAEKVCESIEKVFKLIANKPKRLLVELDHEEPKIKVSLYTAVLSRWMGETQLGEAESSPAS